jgi:soluble lytic murein transglycosylase-like protein
MKRVFIIAATGIILAYVLGVSVCAGYSSRKLPDNEVPGNLPMKESGLPRNAPSDIFAEAERATGCPAEILRGIAGVESRFAVNAVGDSGWSHGMFQLHSFWYKYRVEKYGYFDPFDPAEAAIVAGYIVQENLRSFDGDLRRAVAAYKQGVAGVNRNGTIDWYVDAVLFWRKDTEKLLSFFKFMGITEIGETEYGDYGFGTQVAY